MVFKDNFFQACVIIYLIIFIMVLFDFRTGSEKFLHYTCMLHLSNLSSKCPLFDATIHSDFEWAIAYLLADCSKYVICQYMEV